jgi:hypothetical protein
MTMEPAGNLRGKGGLSVSRYSFVDDRWEKEGKIAFIIVLCDRVGSCGARMVRFRLIIDFGGT